jgi:hypothetical protein
LDTQGQIALLKVIRGSYSIANLRALDSAIFSIESISDAIKKACKAEFPDLSDEILDTLEWQDMQSIQFTSEEVINFIE